MSRARIVIALIATLAFLTGAVGVPTAGVADAATALFIATTDVNIRSGPSTSTKILTTIDPGVVVAAAGNQRGDWQPIRYGGSTGYVFADYVKRTKTTSTPITDRPSGRRTTTTTANLRSAASLNSTVIRLLPQGAVVDATGRRSGDFSEVTEDGVARWVYSKYLGTVTTPPPPPASTTTVVTAAKVAGEYSSGPSPSIDESLGSSSLDRLKPYGKSAVLAVRAEFPEIKTIFGWRGSSAYSSDHPNGRAIDIMIPTYKTNKALGDAIAEYFIANHEELHVNYLLWRQRSYTISRASWKRMADRGSDTENHFNHVHVSFQK